MATSDSQIKVLGIVYKGIYEDYIEVEITSAPQVPGQDFEKELKVYSISVTDWGKRIIKMKQCPFPTGLPPSQHDGELPHAFAEEIKIQMEKL